jgi:hypothetical protein
MAGLGRPPGRTSIVPVNEILTNARIRTDYWDMEGLFESLSNTELALSWCARRRLIRNTSVQIVNGCVTCSDSGKVQMVFDGVARVDISSL